MGKKAKLYVIILINLLAWGYVGYKVYGALQGDDDPAFSMMSAPIKAIDDVAAEDKRSLSLDYPDPFLKGGSFSTARSGGSKPSGGSSKPIADKPRNTPLSKPTASVTAAPAL
ncbi:MAG: hypothetical protein O9353_02500, partial [Bacteroidia bacterium]|nr:hypothetical protein [Bacteroidia bacterium]